jgi:hypothetical protein
MISPTNERIIASTTIPSARWPRVISFFARTRLIAKPSYPDNRHSERESHSSCFDLSPGAALSVVEGAVFALVVASSSGLLSVPFSSSPRHAFDAKILSMPKLDPIEQALNKLGTLKTVSPGPDLTNQLRDFLRNRSNLVVAKAAKISAERRLTNLIPDLVAAFHKHMADPQRLDKRCAAITEIVVALYEMGYVEADVYRKGITHIQMEPSWGGPFDAAARLRGLCAQGLVRTSQPDALAAAVSLLVDPEPPARIGAARALASNGGDAGALLLRLKVLIGDPEPEVLAECFTGLLAAPSSGPGRVGDDLLDFVARYADSEDDAVAEAAILALGAARSLKAIAILKEKWERTLPGPLKKILLLALTTSRNEDALTFLLTQLETAPLSSATEVLTALASQHPADRIRQSIEATLTRRADKSLLATFHSVFLR